MLTAFTVACGGHSAKHAVVPSTKDAAKSHKPLSDSSGPIDLHNSNDPDAVNCVNVVYCYLFHPGDTITLPVTSTGDQNLDMPCGILYCCADPLPSYTYATGPGNQLLYGGIVSYSPPTFQPPNCGPYTVTTTMTFTWAPPSPWPTTTNDFFSLGYAPNGVVSGTSISGTHYFFAGRFPTPTPSPTPAPNPTPPAPSIAKALYTASLLARAKLAFTDAADAQFGGLVWNVSGADKFTSPKFTPQVTKRPPHAGELVFEVPAPLEPGDYPVHVSVTSTTYGTTSAETIVVIRVLPPAYAEASDNADALFQIDASGQLTVDDGSKTANNDDGITPDFGISPSSSAAAAVRAPQSGVVRGPFDPLNPPQPVVNKILFLESENKISCESVLVIDNGAHNAQSGQSPANIRIFGYCRPVAALKYSPTTGWLAEGYDINTRRYVKDTGLFYEPCLKTGQVYRGTWGVCKTKDVPVVSVTGYSEFHQFRHTIELSALTSKSQQNPEESGLYPINKKAVVYPKIPALAVWGTTDEGFVPFPYDRQIHSCPEQPPPNRALPGCFNASGNSRKLGRSLIDNKFPKPGAGYEPHHILPTRWGGDDVWTNGVWLPSDPDHQAFSTWWDTRNFELPPGTPP